MNKYQYLYVKSCDGEERIFKLLDYYRCKLILERPNQNVAFNNNPKQSKFNFSYNHHALITDTYSDRHTIAVGLTEQDLLDKFFMDII